MEKFRTLASKYAILFLLLFIVIGIAIGQTDWFKNLFSMVGSTKPKKPTDGTGCTTTDGSAGLYRNGVCEKIGINPHSSPVSRALAGDTTRASRVARVQQSGYNPTAPVGMYPACDDWINCVPNVVGGVDLNECSKLWTKCVSQLHHATKGTSAPSVILLPIAMNCQQYTTANPYKYQGCSYVYGGFKSQGGIRYCQLKKISCP